MDPAQALENILKGDKKRRTLRYKLLFMLPQRMLFSTVTLEHLKRAGGMRKRLALNSAK